MSYSSEVLADLPDIYYRLNESSGQPQDSSGNAAHTTVTNGTPTYSQSGAIASDPTSTAILFDGLGVTTQTGFRTPDSAFTDLGDVFTLECWAKRRRTGVRDYILYKQTNAYGLFIESDDKVTLNRPGVANICQSTTTITDTTTWHHLVVTKNGASNVKIYVDGVDVTGTPGSNVCTDNTNELLIGFFDNFPNIYIDEIAIYPTVLSQARAQAHYTAAAYTTPVAWITA